MMGSSSLCRNHLAKRKIFVDENVSSLKRQNDRKSDYFQQVPHHEHLVRRQVVSAIDDAVDLQTRQLENIANIPHDLHDRHAVVDLFFGVQWDTLALHRSLRMIGRRASGVASALLLIMAHLAIFVRVLTLLIKTLAR